LVSSFSGDRGISQIEVAREVLLGKSSGADDEFSASIGKEMMNIIIFMGGVHARLEQLITTEKRSLLKNSHYISL